MRQKMISVCLAGSLLAACDTGQSPSAPPPPGGGGIEARMPLGSQARFRSYDAELEDLVTEIPGFGGMFVEGGRLHVHVKNGRALNSAERGAMARFLAQRIAPRSRPSHGVEEAVVVPARFDYRELRRMYRQAGDVIARLPITITDIDDRNNRITIGVRDEAAAINAREMLSRARIPDEAVDVRVVPPTVIEADLQDHVRPTLAGTRIYAPGGCTLSFSGYPASGAWNTGFTISYTQPYFVTNSHCTGTYTGYDGATAGQPSPSYPIGFEIADPAPFTNAQNTECPVGRNCRWADAALFQYSSGVSVSYASVPNVSGLTITGSRSITSHNMPWFIYGPMTVRKIGSESGESSGSLVTTCARIPVYNGSTYQGVDMLCQYQATYTSSGGDSGAPVLNPASETETILHGIHWGRQASPTYGSSYATFSPLGSLQTELEAASGVHIVPCDACLAWWIE
jgi:hypothetical protein